MKKFERLKKIKKIKITLKEIFNPLKYNQLNFFKHQKILLS